MARSRIIIDLTKNQLTDGGTLILNINGNQTTFTATSNGGTLSSQPNTIPLGDGIGTVPGVVLNRFIEGRRVDWLIYRFSQVDTLNNYVPLVVNNYRVEFYSRTENDASFDFGTVSGTLISGNDLEIVYQESASGATGGTGGNVPGNSPSAILVETVNHSIPSRYGFVNAYAFGNSADSVRVGIEFTLPSALAGNQSIAYKFGFVNDEFLVYPNAQNSDYTIAPSAFENKTTLSLQRYVGTTAGFSPNARDKSFAKGSVSLISLGGTRYRLTHDYRLTDFIRSQDVVNNAYENTDLIDDRYVFELAVVETTNPNNSVISTNAVDLTQFIRKGSIGFFDEIIGTGQNPIYELTVLSGNTINPFANTDFQFEIQKLTGNYSANASLKFRFEEIEDSFDRRLTYLENKEFEELSIIADASNNNGTKFINVTATTAGDTVTGSFSIAQGTVQDAKLYALYVSVQDGNASINHQQSLIAIDTSRVTADDSVIINTAYTGETSNDVRFSYFPNTDIANSFNEVKAYVEDRLVSRFAFENTDTPRTTINTIEVGIKRKTSDVFLENIIVNPANLPLQETREYTIPDSYGLSNISIIEVSPNVYEVEYGFFVKSEWVEFNDIVFAVRANFNQGGLNDFKEFQSPDFELGNYNISENQAPDDIFNAPPSIIEYYDETGTTQRTSIVEGENNLIRAIFEANQPISKIMSELYGIIRINDTSGTEAVIRQINTLFNNESDSPLKEILSGVPQRATLIYPFGNNQTVALECIVDSEVLKETFPQAETFIVSARLDETPPPILFIWRTNSTDNPYTFTINGTSTRVVANTAPEQEQTSNINFSFDLSSNVGIITFTAFNDPSLAFNVNLENKELTGVFEANLPVESSFNLGNNINLTGFELQPNSIITNVLTLSNTGISGVLFDGIDVMLDNTEIQLQQCSGLEGVNLQDGSVIVNRLSINQCDIQNILFDGNNVTLLNGFLNASQNTDMTNINLSSSSIINNILFATSSNLTGVLFGSNPVFINGAQVQVQNNPNLGGVNIADNSIINDRFSANIASWNGSFYEGQNITFQNMTIITMDSNPNLEFFELGAGSTLIGQNIAFSSCNLGATVNRSIFDEITATTNFGNLGVSVSVSLQNNNMNQTTVDKYLLELDRISADRTGSLNSAIINLSGTNAAPTGGAANPELVALTAKNYTVIVT